MMGILQINIVFEYLRSYKKKNIYIFFYLNKV